MDKPPVDCSGDLYIAWINFQRRALSMQQVLGFELHFVPSPFETKWLKPLGYVWQALRTSWLVLTRRPKRVWVQSPPTFLPHILVVLRLFRRFGIVADTHHEALIPPWAKVPGALGVLNRCNTVMVHNSESLEEAARLGVDRKRLLVVEDPPPPNMQGDANVAEAARPYVLVPCSFKSDEPIEVLLEAARALPDVEFRVTGNRARAEAQGYTEGAPENVNFTGFIPLEDYDATLKGAAVVLGLTSEEGIQLSVANEALGAGRPLVLSDTRVLRAMFGSAALLTPNTSPGISATLREALDRRTELEERSRALSDRRLAEWVDVVRVMETQ
ncbi:glycosyltransferase [Amaricoccus macauensis]|uniref:glycosyltransferase n=1 Tax=Amaricoccus macauensis TaxID=57001 RepID=UPI003C7A8676